MSKKVVLSGYYGFKNTGDDSLLKSIVNNLKSEKSFSLSKDKLYIDLVELENNEKKITAECAKGGIKSMKCKINKDDKDEINNEYILKENIFFESNKYITITPEEDKYKIFCDKKESINIILIIIIVSICIVAIILIVIILVYILITNK